MPSVAVVGSGISGLTAAHLLSREHAVTVFEAGDRLGGHAHTHDVVDSAGAPQRVDSGFIVHNDRTYPLLRRLFGELGVTVHPTEMSMSISCEGCGLQYAGGTGGRGLLAQPRRLADPRYLWMLAEVTRFQRRALALLETEESADDPQTLGEFLHRHRFGRYVVSHYAVPVVSCVWSSGHRTALAYPARYLFTFLRHHGFLSVGGSPQWFTVDGGSATYVDRLAARLTDVRTGAAVRAVSRGADRVEVRDDADRVRRFDRVVLATHADEALALLADATTEEKRVLGAFDYSRNETVLHTDGSLLPSAPRARAAWNYRMAGCSTRAEAPVVSYSMNRLQGLTTPDDWVVTLNATERIDPGSVVATMRYTHPVYTPAAVAAQRELPGLTTTRTAFAGAYHGWGFHEDGCRAGLAAAEAFGVRW